MSSEYANICGVPVDDLELYFGDRIKILSDHEENKSYPDILWLNDLLCRAEVSLMLIGQANLPSQIK